MADMSWAERMAYMRALTRDEQVAELQGRVDVVAPIRSPEEQLVRDTQRSAIKAIITDLQAEKDRAQEVIDSASSSSDDKKNARAIKRVADASIDLARFVQDIN